MGLGPSLYVAGHQLTRHRKAYLCYSTHTESTDPMCSFQFRVRCLDPCTDFIPVLPFGCLLEDIHLIPQTKLASDLQTKITNRIPGLTAFIAMVGSSHRTSIEHRACPTQVAIKDRMEGTTGSVVAAEYPMVYRTMSHGAVHHTTVCVKVKKVSSHYVVR